MFRHALLKAVARAKTAGALDSFIRYNPYLTKKVFDALDSPPEVLTARALRAARDARYGAGRSMRLSDWPVLQKESLRENGRDFTNPRSLLRMPAGTGGTTGIPLKLWRSLESIAAEQVFIDRLLAPYGVSMSGKTAVLRADSVKPTADLSPPFARISHNAQRLTLSTPHLNRQTIHWFHEALTHFAPSVLWVYPSATINLLTLLRDAGLHLAIPVILASSEVLPPATHARLEEFFNAQVVNYYGQAERVCLAYSTKPDQWHFDPAYGRVELIDSGIRAEGKKGMKIIGTNYWNLAMPLIRYDTGDLLYVPEQYGEKELTEIALGKRMFSGIAGREGEYLLTREGMRIIGMNQIPREVNHVLQMQLVQTDYTRVEVHVIALPDFSSDDAALIKAHAKAKLPGEFEVNVIPVQKLEITARGKTPLVIRKIDG